MMIPTLGFIITQVSDRLLDDYDVEYYHRTREQQFGKPLKQVAAEIDETEVLADVKVAVKDIAALLNQQGGPFFLGKTRWSTLSSLPRVREGKNSCYSRPTASYGDFFLTAKLIWSVCCVIKVRERITPFPFANCSVGTKTQMPYFSRRSLRRTRAAR
jgi:hypothetical protein